MVGEGFQARFTSIRQGSLFTGFLSFLEKMFDPQTGCLMTRTTLNGDETRSGQLAIMPSPVIITNSQKFTGVSLSRWS